MAFRMRLEAKEGIPAFVKIKMWSLLQGISARMNPSSSTGQGKVTVYARLGPPRSLRKAAGSYFPYKCASLNSEDS